MPAAESVLQIVREWIAKAENDLINARHTLRLGAHCPTDTVCFHAQQCAEKYLKALLVAFGKDPPKVHDIETLIREIKNLRKVEPPRLSIEEQQILTSHSVDLRYPGLEDPSLNDARNAVALARRVRSEVRKNLPQEALRHRKG